MTPGFYGKLIRVCQPLAQDHRFWTISFAFASFHDKRSQLIQTDETREVSLAYSAFFGTGFHRWDPFFPPSSLPATELSWATTRAVVSLHLTEYKSPELGSIRCKHNGRGGPGGGAGTAQRLGSHSVTKLPRFESRLWRKKYFRCCYVNWQQGQCRKS